MIVPTKEQFASLIDVQAVKIESGVYKYSKEFERSVNRIKFKPPGRIESVRLANQANNDLLTMMVAYSQFRSKKTINNLITAHTCLTLHLKRLDIEKPKPFGELAYAIWYLNDNEPEVT